MRYFIGIWILLLFGWACSTPMSTIQENSDFTTEELHISTAEETAFSGQNAKGDTVSITDEKTAYEIIIIDPGYYSWLHSIAMPEGYYSQEHMEARNRIYVMNWNQRVQNPLRYDPNLYEMQINYNSNIDYGYQVNYKLYNYFLYFQRKYRQRLGPYLPRIR
ncbi:DUF6146 family protein [Galbibacter sp.]|uniref:DUF6146 family protein n=1 Tax=Galbibacter sp. TaxID=2918471 RepID=UPI003A8C938B